MYKRQNRLGASREPGGIRLAVPDYLQKNFRSLENIAYKIKQNHPNLKRNIKLDDNRLDIYMDIKIDDSADWRKILPEHAREAAATSGGGPSPGQQRTLGAADLTDLIAQGGGGGDEYRIGQAGRSFFTGRRGELL